MNWIDIASIVFISVTMNHLGLINAVEGVLKCKLPIVNCPRCLSFWWVFSYGLICKGLDALIIVLAVSFLASYSAIWLELIEGCIDNLYDNIYDKIFTTEDKASRE